MSHNTPDTSSAAVVDDAESSIPGFRMEVHNGQEYLVPTEPIADVGEITQVVPESPIPGWAVVGFGDREYLVPRHMLPAVRLALAAANVRNDLRAVSGTGPEVSPAAHGDFGE
jgi:hypothetical protein